VYYIKIKLLKIKIVSLGKNIRGYEWVGMGCKATGHHGAKN
jgi:hypothetical protein